MNKKLIIVFCFLLLGLLSGCGLFSPKDKEFSSNGMSVTLTDDFKSSENIQVQMYIVSNKHIFMGNGESKSMLSNQGYYDLSLNEYTQLVLNNAQKSAEIETYKDDDTEFKYAYYESTVEDINYSYMLVCMEGESKFYTMNFGCYTKNFDDDTKEMYLKWAKTINVE